MKDMEIRNKFGDLEKKISMMGCGTKCFEYLKNYHK